MNGLAARRNVSARASREACKLRPSRLQGAPWRPLRSRRPSRGEAGRDGVAPPRWQHTGGAKGGGETSAGGVEDHRRHSIALD